MVFNDVRKITLRISFLIFFSILSVQSLYALDVIKIGKPQSVKDARNRHNYELLKAVLKKTEDKYGAYEIRYVMPMMRNRALAELVAGIRLNVIVVATQPEWEEKAIPVYIPIRKGLLGYRLFLTTRKNINKMHSLEDIEDLKKLSTGLVSQWSIVKALKPQGFNIVFGNNYEGMFKMLNVDRFDYFPRGIDEIFTEYEMRKEEFPEMIIEPTKALYLPLPVYFFVSPKNKEIAKRIETGLWKMIKDGSFDRLFYKHFKKSIEMADLKRRKIFRIDNPALKDHEIFKKKELWFNPN